MKQQNCSRFVLVPFSLDVYHVLTVSYMFVRFILQVNDFMDALRLFEVVLECQQRRHRDLHPDVAAALHNVVS
jgi:hypothetical protein